MSMRVGIANGESFLLAQFREFYEEVVRWKRLASREAEALPAPALAVVGGGETAIRQGGSPGGVMPCSGCSTARRPRCGARAASTPRPSTGGLNM